METLLTKTLISGVLTLLIILSGIWLRKSGEPYQTLIFTLHKLAVATVTVFVILIYTSHFALIRFSGWGLLLFIVSDLIFIAAFTTGSLLSFDKTSSYKLKIVHRVLSWITVLFIPVIWLYCH